MIRSAQQIKFKVISILLATIVTFLVAEIFLRLFFAIEPYRKKDEGDLIVSRKDVNYVYAPNLNETIANSNYKVQVRTNSLGYRDKEWHGDDNSVNILVVGNSFTAGYGVNAEERWSNKLEKNLNLSRQEGNRIKVFNAAVSGYNLTQMSTTVKKLHELVQPDLVIVGLYVDGLNRLEDPFEYCHGFSVRASKTDFVKIDNDKLYLLHSNDRVFKNIEYLLLKHSKMFDLLSAFALKITVFMDSLNEKKIDEGNLDQAEKILISLRGFLNSKGIPLILVPILQHSSNGKFDSNVLEKNRLLKTICHRNGIHVIDLLSVFQNHLSEGRRFWIKRDQHWNGSAHTLAADCIGYYVRDHQEFFEK